MTAGARCRGLHASCLVLGLFAAACVTPVQAEVCKGVPQCEPQKKAAVRYGALDTKGWAYYCTGDHPFYWNPDQTLGLFGFNYSHDNSCFSVSENPFAETDPSKFDATITNWCLKHESITITIGCSAVPQTIAPSCKSTAIQLAKDPGCPQVSGTYRNYCSGGPVPACIQTWEESCASGPAYCTDDLTFTRCFVCPK